LRLTKLELHGFKSFADHTQLAFEPGATMIVGPNGCGKSNVSDAVRWVLGEQRARALRGAKMEEVIFQGSSARRAVNVAEVSLHFDNSDSTLPLAFREVVITRRLSRSGESDYFLNRAPCRLRDIQDLVRGTGLGAESGVVIESKMIDALLSDRPDDRRELFEEAAGVGLYRDRRRSTERRLEETTVDLSRLDDLINEVTSQVRSLARQRKRAERHAELTARRFGVELTLASREMAAWAGELAELDGRLVSLREQAPAALAAVQTAEQAREEAQNGRAAAEARRAELARMVAAQRQAALQLEGEIKVAEERQRNAVARRQRADAERREGEAAGVRVSEDRARAADERAELERALRAAADALQERVGFEEEARGAVAAARAAVEQAERGVRELRDQLRRAELDRDAAGRELQDVAQRAAALDEERAQLADRLDAVRRECSAAEETIALARADVAATQRALDAARATAKAARDEDAAARAELLRADQAVTSLQGKVSALEALERERVGLAPAAAAVLKARDRFGDGAILGPLSDFISAGPAAAALVERYLGPTVHAVVVRDGGVAEAVRGWHASAKPGPLLLLPLDAPAPEAVAEAVAADAADAGTADLAALVDVAGPARHWAAALLGHVRSVADGAAFVDARGAVFLPGGEGGPGPLRRRAELRALRAELETLATARGVATTAADAKRAALQAADHAATVAAEASNAAQVAARRADEHRGELERRRQRAERELVEAQALAERLLARREALAARAAQLEQQAAGLTATLAEREAGAAATRDALGRAERAQDEVRELRTAAQVEQAQAQARLQVAADRERRLAEESETAAARLAALREELSTLAQADSVLAEQMARWQLELESRQASLGDSEARLAEAEAAVAVADDAVTRAQHALDEVHRSGAALGDELHHAELRHTELAGRRAAVRERLETEWRRPLEELLASFEAVEVESPILRAEADTLRQQLDQLGPVNPLAIEEHEEEVKRLDFLTGQRADLAEAKLSLQQAIREIDTTARELFLATFVQVRENFRQIFMTLFGGGECDVRLENPEQPLDCDIEIHASPRGKRTQRIHLLSSGERALVALSLLFGIFLTRPSPFCLLDEVDAPLDDQNVGRFVRMLNQFKKRTQFIVITHNPRTTTEAADSVYGVTMQEPGVSSLVSVRMRAGAVEEAIAGVGEESDAAGVGV